MKKQILSIFLFIGILLSCGENHQHDEIAEQEHAHEHGEANEQESAHNHGALEALQYNLFGSHFELFIETLPFVVDTETELLVHLNTANNCRAVENGLLKINISGENFDKQIVVETFERLGIMKPIIPKLAVGVYSLKFEFSTDSLSETFTISDLKVFSNEDEAWHNANYQHFEHAETFLKEQVWRTKFATQIVSNEPFFGVIKTVGEIIPAQGESRYITAKGNGVLIFASNYMVAGRAVKKGDELFILSGEALGAENASLQFQQLKNSYDKSRLDYLRHKKLAEQQIVSQEVLLVSEADYISDSLSYYNFLNNFSRKGVSITSPVDGFIQNIFAREGEYISTGQAIANVSTNHNLMIRADLSLNYYSEISNIHASNFKLPYNNEVFSSAQLDGKLISVGASVDKNSGFIPVYFQIKNNGKFLEGSFVECYLQTKEIGAQLSVPKSAVIEEVGTYYVYVQVGGESYQKREVKIGQSNGQFVAVVEGLLAGERIVSSGAAQIKLSTMAAKSGLDPHAGHSH